MPWRYANQYEDRYAHGNRIGHSYIVADGDDDGHGKCDTHGLAHEQRNTDGHAYGN